MFKRGFSINACPVNNLFEATLFIAWAIAAAYLIPTLGWSSLGCAVANRIFALTVWLDC